MSDSIVVEPSGRIVASDVRWAKSLKERSKGLFAFPLLEPGQALVIEPGTQVHTFRMRYPIDVVFCDGNWVVKHVVKAMVPNRMTRFVMGARRVIELPAGATGDDVSPGVQLRLT